MRGDDDDFENDDEMFEELGGRNSPHEKRYADLDNNSNGDHGGYSPEPLDDQQDTLPDLGMSSPLGGYAGLGYSAEDEKTEAITPYIGIEEPQMSSVESRNRWEQKTIEGLNQAKALTRHALRNTVESDVLHSNAKRNNHNNSNIVNNTIKKKIGITEDLIKALEDRIESVEDTIRQIGECLFQLQRAHRSKWAPLNVCERRLELRATRPMQELIRDACQEALEHERQTTIEARQELADQIESMKQMLISLDGVKDELVLDLQHKRHALRIDRSCLSTKKLATERVANKDRLVLPSLHEVTHYGSPPSPGKDSKAGGGHKQEEGRQEDTRMLISKAVTAEEAAMRLANECDSAMIHTKRECTRASNQAQTELQRRIEETHALKKQLEAQIHETDDAIVQTEVSLMSTRKRLDSHDQPLRALDKQFAMRGNRTSREGIRDPVHEEMEGHLDTLKKNVRTLTEKWQTTKDILEQLRSTKQRLQGDYKCKLAAQKIDDACAKVTPRKAIELDRMDPRAGRCRPESQKKYPREYKATFADGGWQVTH